MGRNDHAEGRTMSYPKTYTLHRITPDGAEKRQEGLTMPEARVAMRYVLTDNSAAGYHGATEAAVSIRMTGERLECYGYTFWVERERGA
jgi:hypothetical protein